VELGCPKEPCIRWGLGSPMGRGNFEEGKEAAYCRDYDAAF